MTTNTTLAPQPIDPVRFDHARGDEIQWRPFSRHRADSLLNKRLLTGEEGAPDCFEFSVVRTIGPYHTPRHKHNFDQVRFQLDGAFATDRGVQRAGMIGYFPEGVPYAQRADDSSTTLLLQIGGASGAGFMTYQQMEHGHAALAQHGSFEGGLYLERDATGHASKKDAYQAIWEWVNQKEIAYPEPRYQSEVMINPEAFAWVGGEHGVRSKALGAFTERGLALHLFSLDEGAAWTTPPGALVYVIEGAGAIETATAFATGDALRAYEQGVHLSAAAPTHLLAITLPRFA
jgi:hypothetical protein